MRSRIVNRRSGFTLTEIMIVLVVLGLLMAVALPRVSQVLFTGKTSATKTSLGSISKACKNFNADTGAWPGNILDLMQPFAVGADCYHPKTLAKIQYTPVHVKNWKGPYVDGTTAEVSTDGFGGKIAIGTVAIANPADFKFDGVDMDRTPVTVPSAKDSTCFMDIGGTPGLYLHSKGEDTAAGTTGQTTDDLFVFVSSKTQ